VNEGRKYLITQGNRTAIQCDSDWCACFGSWEIGILSNSNINTENWCSANRPSFNLPAAKGSEHPSMNGGEHNFLLKQFEVYSVSVRITINIIFRKNEQRKGATKIEMTY
jgi:hypothetical protein